MLARPAAGIEAANPLPRVRVARVADAPRDGAYLDVAVIDMPAVGAFGIAAADARVSMPIFRIDRLIVANLRAEEGPIPGSYAAHGQGPL